MRKIASSIGAEQAPDCQAFNVIRSHSFLLVVTSSTVGDSLRFSRESSSTLGIVGQLRWQDFERNLAVERGVLGQIDFAHPARADLVQDLVVADSLADQLTGIPFCPPGTPTLYTHPLPEPANR